VRNVGLVISGAVAAAGTFQARAALADAPSAPVASDAKTGSTALLFDTAVGFVPFANDVPLMLGAGVRFAEIHEVWARGGYMSVGDDVRHGFGVAGYRAVLRPQKLFRPVLGALFAGLPATCTHDAGGHPVCSPPPLFIFAALGGVRIEPNPWLGVSAILQLGTDTHPNPFGMVELGLTFALPLS
jgi:hypothetical protein